VGGSIRAHGWEPTAAPALQVRTKGAVAKGWSRGAMPDSQGFATPIRSSPQGVPRTAKCLEREDSSDRLHMGHDAWVPPLAHVHT
jgi:hypothetical protein